MLFLMVIRLVAQSNSQLLELPHPLAVDVQPRLCGRSRRVVLEEVMDEILTLKTDCHTAFQQWFPRLETLERELKLFE